MSSKPFALGVGAQIRKRYSQAQEFYRAALDPEERPWFVSDAATVYDIYVGDEAELIEKCEQHYGVEINRSLFQVPLWQLLDYLDQNRTKT